MLCLDDKKNYIKNILGYYAINDDKNIDENVIYDLKMFLEMYVKKFVEDENEAEMLMAEIEKIESEITELKRVWQGEEAEIYYIRADNYITKLKSIPETYKSMARFLERANIMYKEADLELKRKIDNVRMNG